MWFMILFFGCIIAYLIWAANYNIKKSEEKHQKENDINEKGNEYNAVYSTEINHICGLPLSENSRCILHLCDNQIVVEGTGQIFN